MITKPKGTYDIYGKDSIILENINEIVKNYMSLYNVEYIRTPIFESSELFHRGVGDTSDIVTKETYDFKDRGDRSITLRPEGTASVARSVIENKLYGNRNDLMKYYYFGTMYRYERPQSGRNREFTQFGVEAFNSSSIKADAEIISIGYNIINELGLDDVTVHINTLGDDESRKAYTNALKEYIKPHLEDLCEDCKKRYETNPLRIIDCKVDSNKEIFTNLPKISDYLTENSKKRFKELKDLLMMLEVDFVVNEKIVRGLDYYTETVYEFINEKDITLGGGGRYDKLTSSLEGPVIPSVGFALGLERIIIELKEKYESIKNNLTMDAFILAVSDEEKYHALKLSQSLRLNGIRTELCINDLSLKSQFKLADNYESKFLIILNNEDLQKGLVTVKDNILKEEEKVDEYELVEYLLQNL